MEELPLLSENERDQLVDTLKESEVRIKAGDYTQYDRKKFKNRLLRIYRGKQR